MKTLQECKDEIAKKYGIAKFEMAKVFRSQSYEKMLDEAAQLYAQEACEGQRVNCAVIFAGNTFHAHPDLEEKILNARKPDLL